MFFIQAIVTQAVILDDESNSLSNFIPNALNTTNRIVNVTLIKYMNELKII